MENYPQAPANANTNATPAQQTSPTTPTNVFPYAESQHRLANYDYFNRLLMGDHFSAFGIKIDDEDYNRAYAKLRYVRVNFAGLLSKIVADMLFGEPIIVKDKENQDFIDALWTENKMDVQCFESALGNSALGDAVFKVRVGKRKPNDTKSTIIIEDITPKIYFPNINGFNVRAEPSYQEIAWTFTSGNKTYLRKEIHKPGLIENKVYEMQGNKIMAEVGLEILGEAIAPQVPTGIEEYMIVHVPNWKTGDKYFGISDYYDLDALFYGINHRMSQIDNILDKHGDPILMAPPGVLDKKGKLNKKALGVIEVVDNDTPKPEYIVWDASLENAFKYIEKLVEFFYLVGEVSPDVLGMGEGVSDSGRALKFKLMRTIAKVARKRLYYDAGIKQVIYVAELLAKRHNLSVGDETFKGEPTRPEIQWADGLPIDSSEAIDTETKAIDAGLTSKRDAIMRIYQVDEETADEMVEQINEETSIKVPSMDTGGTSRDFLGDKTDTDEEAQKGTKPNTENSTNKGA